MKKLNRLQVEELYQFTRRHYVEYYDVQTELVDHLANGIEEQWKEDPEVSFEEALQKEFKKFGVYGFSDVVEKRQRAMEKRYFRLIWKEHGVVLKRPKVVFWLLFLFFGSKFLLNLEEGSYTVQISFLIVFCLILLFIFRRSFRWKKARKGKKVFLFEAIIDNTGGLVSLVWIPFQLLNYMNASETGFISWLMSLMITFVALATYVCFFHLPHKKEEILLRVYPEMKYS